MNVNKNIFYKIIVIFSFIGFLLINNANNAFAEYIAPKPVGYVNDFAGVMNAESVKKLNGIIEELKSKTGAETVVVTLKSLESRPIEDVGLSIGRQWKIGDKKKQNGILVIVAPNDRKVRIEVGYGLEGFITDAHAGRIRDTYMLPYFKAGDYEKGIIYGTSAIVSSLAKSYGVTISGNYKIPQPEESFNFGDFIFIAFFLFFFTRIMLESSRNPTYGRNSALIGGIGFGTGFGLGSFGGSSDFGGFGGFGGGGFGGGGASGGW